MPDAARGIEATRDYGRLDATMQDQTFLALKTLVANVFSGGSIATETFTPSFALNHRDHDSTGDNAARRHRRRIHAR